MVVVHVPLEAKNIYSMARYRAPQPLGHLIHGVIDDLGIKRRLDEARMIEGWAIVAGPQINGVTESAWVKGNLLYVKIHSAAWRHELHLHRNAWRNRLNKHLGQALVREIIFR